MHSIVALSVGNVEPDLGVEPRNESRWPVKTHNVIPLSFAVLSLKG